MGDRIDYLVSVIDVEGGETIALRPVPFDVTMDWDGRPQELCSADVVRFGKFPEGQAPLAEYAIYTTDGECHGFGPLGDCEVICPNGQMLHLTQVRFVREPDEEYEEGAEWG